jgi:hypothetical protein
MQTNLETRGKERNVGQAMELTLGNNVQRTSASREGGTTKGCDNGGRGTTHAGCWLACSAQGPAGVVDFMVTVALTAGATPG